MTAEPPTVPPAHRFDKGTGSAPETPFKQGGGTSQIEDPGKVGRAGNSKVVPKCADPDPWSGSARRTRDTSGTADGSA